MIANILPKVGQIMKRKITIFIVYVLFMLSGSSSQAIAKSYQELYDVTVVGYLRFSNGLGRNAIAALDYLQDSLKMNYKKTRPSSFSLTDCPSNVIQLLQKNNPSAPSNVAILYDVLDILQESKMPDSKIKLAYTMLEATAIFPQWVDYINKGFDAVVVPDPFLEEVYRSSGVKKPIFVLAHPVYLDAFLAKPPKMLPNRPFVFGISCVLSHNKNHMRIVDAFISEFGNSPDVLLKIQCPINNTAAKELKRKLRLWGIRNITLNTSELPWNQYIEFMSSIDCYCLVSKGEGFSVTPREALALGIPCILSNNTAHQTICKEGLVYAIPSTILEPHINNKRVCGHNFNCKLEDVKTAMRTVYQNYDQYLAKAHLGREWVKQYRGENLKKKYVNLFKPSTVILGDKDEVTDDYLMTKDPSLYAKYKSLAISQTNISKDTIGL